MNVAKALAAFNRVTGDGDVPPADHPRKRTALGGGKRASFLPALEQWLDNGAWRNDPPAQAKQRPPQTKRRRGGGRTGGAWQGGGW